jgi:hypothetical protein
VCSILLIMPIHSTIFSPSQSWSWYCYRCFSSTLIPSSVPNPSFRLLIRRRICVYQLVNYHPRHMTARKRKVETQIKDSHVYYYTNLRNNLTTGLHFTTPGGCIPSEGGLHEYCTISSKAHLWRSMGSPLRRFSLKALCTIWTRSGRSEVEKMGTRGAIPCLSRWLGKGRVMELSWEGGID